MSSDPFRNYDMWLLSGNPLDNDPCFDCPDDQCESCGLCTKHCECDDKHWTSVMKSNVERLYIPND